MGKIIVIAGKGGTGKTTIASLLIEALAKSKKGSILAVDADPNSNLAEYLGLPQNESIGGILEEICKNPDMLPKNMSKDEYIDYRIQTALAEGDGLDLVAMGRPEGPGCYCFVNNVLRNIVDRLIKKYDYIVIDNEAGFEHLSRRTTRSADYFLLVMDYSRPGLRAARRINDLAKELDVKIKNTMLVINRRKLSDLGLEEEIKKLGIKDAQIIPEDAGIMKLSMQGLPLSGLKQAAEVKMAMGRILERIWSN